MSDDLFSFEEAMGKPVQAGPAASAFSAEDWRAASAAQQGPDVLRQRRRILASEARDLPDPADRAAAAKDLAKLPKGATTPDDSFSFEEAVGPRSETDIQIGGAKAATKAVARSVADFGDMILSIPSMLMGTGADVASRVQSFLEGTDRRAAARIAKTVREGVTETFDPKIFRTLLEKSINAVMPDDQEAGPSDVQKGMEVLSKGIEKGGKWVEEVTGGKILAEDFDSLVNEGMALGGLRGAGAAAKAVTPKGKPIEPGVPTPEPSPPPTPAQRAVTDYQAIINKTTGVDGPTPAARAARQKQARAAFAEDPQYADYLQNFANEEARVRELAATKGEFEGLFEQLDKETPSKVGGAEPVVLTPEGKIDTGVIGQRPLDTAMAKINRGEGFNLTAEEVLALRKNASAWARRDVEQPFNRQSGQIDRTLLNILAVGGTAAVLAKMYPEQAQDTALAAMMGGAILTGDSGRMAAKPEASSLRVMLEESGTTLKTLERLSGDRNTFTKEMIEQQLRRDDVTKAEKEVFAKVLADVPAGGSISAKNLVLGFKKATGDFELRPKEVDAYANYGLENIDRLTLDNPEHPDFVEGEWVNESHGPPARTTIYQAPMELGTGNHFSDPNYFAHTRSFDEGGVRHVVEIQSDLAQKTRAMTPAERELAEAGKREAEEHVRQLMEIDTELDRLKDGTLGSTPDTLRNLIKALPERLRDNLADRVRRIGGSLDYNIEGARNVLPRHKIRQALEGMVRDHALFREEFRAKLEGSRAAEAVAPMFKDWYKRIVREEIAYQARELELKKQQLQRLINDPKGLDEGPWKRELAELEAASPVMRFATADTVAKVEGWPEPREHTLERIRTGEAAIRRMEAELETVGVYRPGVRRELEHAIQREVQVILNNQGLLASLDRGARFAPQHQSIYDRYKGDIEKFLRNLGGKPVTDSAGHTWLEVPVESGPKGMRAQMFGGSDIKTLGRIAIVGTAVAAGTQLDKDHPIQGGILGWLGGAVLASGLAGKIGRAIWDARKPDSRIRIDDAGNEHEYLIQRTKIDAWRMRHTIETLVPDAERREVLQKALNNNSAGGLAPQEARAYQMLKEFWGGFSGLGKDVQLAASKSYTAMLKDSPTADPAVQAEMFANAVGRATANKLLIDKLKTAETNGGANLLMAADKAPANYVSMRHPSFQGLKMHPDILPSMEFLFDTGGGSRALRAVETFNTTMKRLAVSYSLFHAKALSDAAVGAIGPFQAAKGIAQAVAPRIFGTNKYLKELRDVGVGPTIDMALKGGLKIALEKGVGVEDVGQGFYEGLRSLQRLADASIPGSGRVVSAFEKTNHAFDNFMWARLQTGLKLMTFSQKYEALLRNNPKLPREEAARIAASFSNDMYGGLNWRRIAEGVQNRYGRSLALTILSPEMRRFNQLLLFAPDWTLSTTRAFTQAIGKGSGIRGALPDMLGGNPKTLADLHRQYLVRSALYYLMVGDAMNYAFSGHHLWDNKDWTRIDLGDGRTMQWSKHTMEPIHWIQHPVQQGLNKLGYIPKEGLSQIFGVEYLNPRTDKEGNVVAGPQMKESRVAHALKAMSPIGVQQFNEGGTAAGLSGMVGVPIYGKTKEQRDEDRRQRRIKRLKEMSDAQR